MKLIGLADLPNDTGVSLSERFRKELFANVLSKISAIRLSEKLNVHPDTVMNLHKGKTLMRLKYLKDLIELSGVCIDVAEKSVTGIRSKKKDKVRIRFPIVASPELASVVAHCMGDGSLTKRQFSYFNQRRELVEAVVHDVKKSLSTNIDPAVFVKCGGWEIEYPTSIGKLLFLLGAPLSKKVYNPFRVPKWIMCGSDNIKAAFLRALFDDEGWVKIKINHKTKTVRRMIGINMSKNPRFLKQHKLFFEDIRCMLASAGIESSKVVKMGRTKNGTNLGIVISNFNNLAMFSTKVGFVSECKREKLLDCLTNSKRFNLGKFKQQRLLFK